MGYTNSKLATYTHISPNKTVNRTKIDTITIHCMVGQMSARSCADYFAKSSTQASSNYCVGYDGSVALSVSEADRAWCSSNKANDMRAVTIEVASDTYEPYAVRQAAYDKLILLVADICQRNGIKQLKWSTNKNERVNHLNGCNMTVHRDYAAKSCPGTWLYNKMGQIANEVNTILNGGEPIPAPQPDPGFDVNVHTLQQGSYGAEVKTVQRILYARGYTDNSGREIEVDGDFGPATKQATIKLQKYLFPYEPAEWDGIWGTKTWQAALAQLW